MNLDESACRTRLGSHGHGVLATVHRQRGVDAVPAVFAVVGRDLVVPVDAVKAKRAGRLQRLRNIDADGRCVLLVDHYDEDWSALWWVRVHAEAVEIGPTDPSLVAVASHFPVYRAPGALVGGLVLRPSAITGWSET